MASTACNAMGALVTIGRHASILLSISLAGAALILLPLSVVMPSTDVAVAATPSTVSCTAPSGPAPSTGVVGGFHGVSPERLVDTRQAQLVPPGCWLRIAVLVRCPPPPKPSPSR